MLRFAVEFEQIADNGRTDKRMLQFRHQIDRFDFRIERFVQVSQLEFELEIADCAKSSDQDGSPQRICQFYGEIVKTDDLYPL